MQMNANDVNYTKQWEFLKNTYLMNQLSHAYIFSGSDIKTIRPFAKEFIQYINCLAIKKICKNCQNCKMIEREAFPDLHIITSANSESSLKNETDNLEIDISQIRDAQNFLAYKSYYGTTKVVVVEHAERMNLEAQNCFLKTLEEPKGKTLIILMSAKPELLLPTIFSRCQQIKFFEKEKQEISKEEQGVLGELLPVITSDFAQKFLFTKQADLKGQQVSTILTTLQRYFRYLLLQKIGAQKESSFFPNPPALLQSYSVNKIKNIIQLIESLSYQTSFTNASPKLALEILFLEI